MTDKQKQAVTILNRLHEEKIIKYDEYFLLLDFITLSQNHNEPYLDPFGKFGPVIV